MDNIEKYSNKNFLNDVNNFVYNINNIFNEQEDKFNIRTRSIDFIDTIYFICNYNSNIVFLDSFYNIVLKQEFGKNNSIYF